VHLTHILFKANLQNVGRSYVLIKNADRSRIGAEGREVELFKINDLMHIEGSKAVEATRQVTPIKNENVIPGRCSIRDEIVADVVDLKKGGEGGRAGDGNDQVIFAPDAGLNADALKFAAGTLAPKLHRGRQAVAQARQRQHDRLEGGSGNERSGRCGHPQGHQPSLRSGH